MRSLSAKLLIVLMCLSLVCIVVPLGKAQDISSDILLSPLSATIGVGESLPFTVTITQELSYSPVYQWYVNGTQVVGANYPSWAFTPTAAGNYGISVTVSKIETLNSPTNNASFSQVQVGVSQTAQVKVTASSLTGSFGYSNVTSQAGGHGEQYLAVGSRFTLDINANVTSMSALIGGQFGNIQDVNWCLTYSFGIYTDVKGQVGTLVAQTGQGVLPFVWDGPLAWKTLYFASPVQLQAGGYWLMEIDNGSEGSLVNMASAVVNGYTTVEAYTGGMVFPTQMNSPIYTQNYVECIFASYNNGLNASPVNPVTPSPTSSPTSSPTVTPLNQTEFTPSLQLTCTGASLTTSLAAQINGTLAMNGSGVPQVPVLLSYSVTYGSSWTDLTTVITDNNGGFTVDWTPSATGTYLIRAIFTGNDVYPPASTTVTFVLAPSQEQSIFSVTSNSTISAFLFDSVNKQLSFTVSGPSGTTGYVDISIPKSMISDISNLQVKLDDNQIAYTAQSQPNSWLVSFQYHHSTHTITIDFNSTAHSTPTSQYAIYAVAVVVIAVVAIVLAKRKK